LVANNERPAGMTQQQFESHLSHLCWFAGGFMCALVAVSWLVVP
jgi:hypothetical protein